MKKGNTKKTLTEALGQQHFWVNNGPILSDLVELHSALKGEINAEQFSHHVTDEKNDFADWIEQTLGDHECASSVRSVKKQSTVAEKVKACLKKYKH